MIAVPRTVQFVLVALAAAGVLVLKCPDTLTNPQFWAEDGAVFFAQQRSADWPLVLEPYAGYLHAVPRIVAWIATAARPSDAPLIYNAVALVIGATCIAYVTTILRGYVAAPVVFCSFFLVPSVGDVFGTLTNVQWFLQFALAVACLVPCDQMVAAALWTRGVGYLALALAALTGPFSVLLSLIAIMAVLAARIDVRLSATRPSPSTGILSSIAIVGRHVNIGPLLVVMAGACVQAAVMLLYPVETPWREMLLTAAQQQELGIHELRSPYVQRIAQWKSTEHLVQIAAMGAICLACLVQAIRQPSHLVGLCFVLLVLGGVQPVLAFSKQRELHVFAASAHYFYLLSVVSCWAGWAIMLEWWPRLSKLAPWLWLGALAAIAVWLPTYFQRAPLHDLHWQHYAQAINRGEPAIVPINPVPWHFFAEPRRR